MRGCEGYVVFAQDDIRWAAWSDEKFGGVWEGVLEGDGKGDDVTVLTALNGRPGACQGVGMEGGETGGWVAI